MIERYNTTEMARIWSEENKYETWKKESFRAQDQLSFFSGACNIVLFYINDFD